MSNKSILITIGIVLIGLGALAFTRSDNRASVDPAFAQFKKNCRIVEQGPFQDDGLGIRFQFSSDAIVCDYSPLVQETKSRELYVWNKEAFNRATMEAFGEGILAKVTVNPLTGLPTGTTVSTTNEMIAGKSTPVRTVKPQGCNDVNCPTARVAEFSHKGNTLVLEEYAVDANLFRSVELLAQ